MPIPKAHFKELDKALSFLRKDRAIMTESSLLDACEIRNEIRDYVTSELLSQGYIKQVSTKFENILEITDRGISFLTNGGYSHDALSFIRSTFSGNGHHLVLKYLSLHGTVHVEEMIKDVEMELTEDEVYQRLFWLCDKRAAVRTQTSNEYQITEKGRKYLSELEAEAAEVSQEKAWQKEKQQLELTISKQQLDINTLTIKSQKLLVGIQLVSVVAAIVAAVAAFLAIG